MSRDKQYRNSLVATKSSDPVYTHFTKLELYYMLAHLSLKAI
jgi:hypothetical protein